MPPETQNPLEGLQQHGQGSRILLAVLHFPWWGRKMHYIRFEKDLDVDNRD